MRTLFILAAMSLAVPGTIAAQGLCEDDAGASCEDDGGVDNVPIDAGARADAGSHDGGIGGVVCSCETDTDEGGRIHVCTGSDEAAVCETFSCERGTVRQRECPSTDAVLCCTMRVRGLTSQLYEDCTHPNCESGFREQCKSFGGNISNGACGGNGTSGYGSGSDDGEDSGGLCAVSRGVRAGRFEHASWLLICAGVLRLLRRNRRRSRTAP